MSGNPVIRQCMFCKCMPDDRCRLETGEECIYMEDRCHCTNPWCIVAADRERKSFRRKKKEQINTEVKPIRDAWHNSIARRRKESEMQRKRRRKTKGRAA